MRGDEGATFGDRLSRAATRLDDDGLHRAAALADDPVQLVLVEALATQRDQQHSADVGVRAQPLHHRFGVGVRVTAREADDVYVLLAKGNGDFARDMVSALDEVADDDRITNALPTVGARITLHHAPLPYSARMSSRW